MFSVHGGSGKLSNVIFVAGRIWPGLELLRKKNTNTKEIDALL